MKRTGRMRAHPKMINGLKKLVQDSPDGIMVEIGSYQGESASVFAESGKFTEIHCVDPWLPYKPGRTHAARIKDAEGFFDMVVKKFPCIIKHKTFSVDAANLFEDESLDLVYIDGQHTYPQVIQDLETWVPKVRRGGWIAGHDYYNSGILKEVKNAVNTFFGGPPERTYIDSSWMYALYKKFL